MIARAKAQGEQTLQETFIDMLPRIKQQARFAFRSEPRERRDEYVGNEQAGQVRGDFDSIATRRRQMNATP